MKKISIILLSLMLIISMTACDPKMEQKSCIHVIETENATAYFDEAKKYPSAGICSKCGETVTLEGISVSTPDDLMSIASDIDSSISIGTNLINIANDIDMADKTWDAPFLSGYEGAKTFIIDGNGYKISNLKSGSTDSPESQGLIGRIWSNATLEIRNLTLEDPQIIAGEGNDKGPGIGGFVGYIEASPSVKFTNCHINGGNIGSGHWAGGFYGYAAGYDVEGNGPVLSVINIDGCSVDGVTITGTDASVGGIMGHAGGNPNTEINVSNTSVTNCTITTTGANKAGNILGTNNVATTTLTNVTYSGNTVKAANVENKKAYGRLAFVENKDGSISGSLTIDGKPITEAK